MKKTVLNFTLLLTATAAFAAFKAGDPLPFKAGDHVRIPSRHDNSFRQDATERQGGNDGHHTC
jgi:hypothetical protein